MTSRKITKRQAEQALAAIKEQFKAYLGSGADEPTLYEPGFHTDAWSIAWEGGPFQWTYIAFVGGFDEEVFSMAEPDVGEQRARQLATTAAVAAPAGVYGEAVNHWCLALYPA